MRRLGLAILVPVIGTLLSGCPSTAAHQTVPAQYQSRPALSADATALAARYGLTIIGPARSVPLTLPPDLVGANWGSKQAACADAGFDLRPYTGMGVAATSRPLKQRYGGVSSDLWTIESGGHVVGAYVAPHWTGSVLSLKDAATGR